MDLTLVHLTILSHSYSFSRTDCM